MYEINKMGYDSSMCLIPLIVGDYGNTQTLTSTSETKYVKTEGELILRKKAHSKRAKVTMLKNGSIQQTQITGFIFKQGNFKGYVKTFCFGGYRT